MRTFYTAFGLRCVHANQFNAELPKCPVELRNPFAGQTFGLIDVKDGVQVTIKAKGLPWCSIYARVVSI